MNETHLYTSDEKIKWFGYGEWVEEPDLVEWEYNAINCKILRIVLPDGSHIFGGHLCGYVQLPSGHPWEKLDPFDIPDEVHGGITFLQKIAEEYWIGFDCGHSEDIVPSTEI